MSFRTFCFFLFFPTTLFSYSIETHGFNLCPRIQLSCAFCGSISNEKTCVIIPYRWDPVEKKHICGRVECSDVKESEKRMVEQDDGKKKFSLNNNSNPNSNTDDNNSTQVF